MAHRRAALSLVLVGAACGGSVGINSAGNGAGGSVASGTGGLNGTATTGGAAATGGWNAVTGGAGQGGVDWTACGTSDTCVLEPAVSCIGCEPVPLSSYTAVNSTYAGDYLRSLPQVECVSLPCAAFTPDQLGTPNYYATCTQGHCQAVDIRTSPLSACSSSSDCYVRAGTTCCGCGNSNWVAASNKANMEQVLCAPAAGCAADCVSEVAPCLSAFCSNANGHCALSYFRPD